MGTNEIGSVNFDKILDKIGNLGRYQLLHISILMFVSSPCGLFNLANVFFAAVPKYKCSNTWLTNNISLPENVSFSSNSIDVCEYRDGSNITIDLEETCTEWIFDTSDYDSNIVTEWQFVCSREWLASLSQTIYMFGILTGAFIAGNVGDRFGRKRSAVLGLLVQVATGISAAYVPNYWAFIAVRHITAIGTCLLFVNAFVHIMEIVATKYRMQFGVYFQLPFAMGYMLLSGVAYFIRDFRHLQLFTGLFPVLSIPLYYFIDESPRWLMTKGRFDEARSIVKKMCLKNGVEYPENLMEKETAILIDHSHHTQHTKIQESKEKISQESTGVLDLIRTPKLRFRMFAIAYAWILCSLTYYGLSQASSNLIGGPYLNLFLSGIMEFPGMVICCWLLNKIGRKWTLSGVFFLAGSCILLVPVVLNKYSIITTILSMIGKMAISGAFGCIYVYTAELFPTVIRSIAVGTGSMSSRIGSILSPNIILLAKVWVGFPFIMFGGLTVIGAFVSLVLPETFKHPMMETVEEGESLGGTACENICQPPTCIRRTQEDEQEIEIRAENGCEDVKNNNLIQVKF